MASAAATTPKKGNHTILLMQIDVNVTSRTYRDFESEEKAFNNVVKMYELRLRELNPTLTDITYDVSNLFAYIDSLADLSALVFSPKTHTYEPYGKEWIKAQVFAQLKRQAM